MEGWKSRKLGDVCPIDKQIDCDASLPYVGLEHIQAGKGQLVISAEPADAESSTFRFTPEHVLYGRLRPYLNKVLAPDFTGRCSSEIFPIKPVTGIDRKFVFYWLMQPSIVDAATQTSTGARMPRANMNAVMEFEFAFPPLLEQKRIVAILDEACERIDKAIANTEKNLANSRELFDARLEEIFEHRSPPWSRCVLKEICDRVSVGHVGPTSQHYCDREVGIAFLRSQNVRPGTLDIDDVRYVTPEFHNILKKSQLRAGDLLFVRVGANRGDCCSVPEGLGELNCANIVLARPNKGCVRFLEYYCRSHSGRKQLLGMTTGSAQGVINTGAVAELSLPFPDESDQRATVEILDARFEQCRSLEVTFAHKLAELRSLKNALLSSAFFGHLGSGATRESREAAE